MLLGLIGAGIERSRTPEMHEREAAAHGMRCVYRLFDVAAADGSSVELPRLLDEAERAGFAGLNITHPFKEAVVAHLSALSDDARALGAVNTVVFANKKRVGHNTDWQGFRESVVRGLAGARLSHVVQLGAGGAGAATAYAVLKLGAERLDLVDVIQDRAQSLADRLNAHFPGRAFAVADPGAAVRSADGLVHATPTGMAAHPGLPIPAELLRQELWVAEVVYFPLETELLRAARQRGCRTLDGAGMAVGQAVEAFRLFSGVTADPDRMRTFFNESSR
jgi:shikimate dehydrogenase